MQKSERSLRDIQDDCALIAAELEILIQRSVRLREELRLPADTLALYEKSSIPWPVEVAVDAALESAIDEELAPEAGKDAGAPRVFSERAGKLAPRVFSERAAKPAEPRQG